MSIHILWLKSWPVSVLRCMLDMTLKVAQKVKIDQNKSRFLIRMHVQFLAMLNLYSKSSNDSIFWYFHALYRLISILTFCQLWICSYIHYGFWRKLVIHLCWPPTEMEHSSFLDQLHNKSLRPSMTKISILPFELTTK